MSVLIVSSASDAHIPPVLEELCGLNVLAVRLDTETLADVRTTIRIMPTDEKLRVAGRIQMEVTEISAVWYRRPKVVDLSRYELSKEGLSFAEDEWHATLRGLYTFLDKAIWVSHPYRIQLAENKVLQLRLAKSLGFNIPQTLITNDKQEAVGFWNHLGGKVVAKSIGLGWVYVSDVADGKSFVRCIMTNALSTEWMSDLDSVQIAPVLFQEMIPKSYELRITVIGREVFAVRIDSQRSELARVDWRRDSEGVTYQSYKLPAQLADRCRKLIRSLKLQFGAIDMIYSPSGEYVFLEVNPNGQFLWLEDRTGLPLAQAMARLLSGMAPPLA